VTAVPSSQDGRERGQIVPLLALAVVIAAGAALLLAHLGVQVVDRARARTAADAAALAGVQAVETSGEAAGRSAAEREAVLDGARLEGYSRHGDEVEVEVRVGDERASASAAPGDGATMIPSG